jgi:hypothetical protein
VRCELLVQVVRALHQLERLRVDLAFDVELIAFNRNHRLFALLLYD